MNKLTYIYENEHGITCFDKYFSYLETVENSMPTPLALFATDHSRYQLNNDHTLHDAWLKAININKEYDQDNKPSTIVQLQLLHASHKTVLTLNYAGVTEVGCSLTPDRWTHQPTDLLAHEFTKLSENTYRHAIQFDRAVWLTVSFSFFNFEENLA